MTVTVAVITIVSGRHQHLRSQTRALAQGSVRPDVHVVVAMDDPGIAEEVDLGDATVVHLARESGGLPLARARNTGAATARALGAELLVFLDVDCIPAPDLITRYRDASDRWPAEKMLFCGPVTYLGEDDTTEAQNGADLAPMTAPHRARPSPPAGSVRLDTDMDLFWSLSFAITADNWHTLGGFHPGYSGYGGEDTDFGQAAGGAGFRIAWVGGAHAYHQFHPVSNPPVEHLDDILLNAAIFHGRWGWWPMTGWLNGFADLGLATFDSDKGWVRTSADEHSLDR
jgi:GT2 family glycosyltransferase